MTNDTTEYHVWADMTGQPFDESPARWAIVASFRYFQEALDFVAYMTGRGTEAHLTGSAGLSSHYGADGKFVPAMSA